MMVKGNLSVWLALLICLIGGCKKDTEATIWTSGDNSSISPRSNGNRVIYEVNVRNFSESGDLAGVEQQLPRLKALGVDILWLMPIHPVGELNRNGSLGSPYAVKDYRAVNPEFGTLQDFRSLVNAAHAMGLEIWMDWVANHTAWDHEWVTQHLDYYAEKDGQRPYSPEDWEDVVQLDFENPALRSAMIEAMAYWVDEYGIDGFRCDAATFVPLSFWREARQHIDAIKPITWLAEGDKPTYMEVFDYDYAWAFSNSLTAFGKNNNVTELVVAMKALHQDVAYANKGRMVYLTNHDLNAHEGTEFNRLGGNVLPLTVLSFTVHDMPLIYNGQEVGMDRRIGLFDRDPLPWDPINKHYVDLFHKLTELKRTHPALEDGARRGKLKIYPTNNQKMLVFARERDGEEVLVVLNLGNVASTFRFTEAGPIGQYKNYLEGGYHEFDGQRGIALLENGYKVFIK